MPVDSPARHIVAGLVQIFTAPHRSFFTSVMAQALREAGQGTRVLVVQFLKGGINMGHQHPMHLCQHLDWYRCNLPRCIDTPELEATEMQAMQEFVAPHPNSDRIGYLCLSEFWMN